MVQDWHHPRNHLGCRTCRTALASLTGKPTTYRTGDHAYKAPGAGDAEMHAVRDAHFATGTVSAYTLSIRCSCVFREGMLSLQLACGRCMLHRQPRLGRYSVGHHLIVTACVLYPRGFPRRISWRYSDKWHLNLVGIAEFITDV